MGVMRQREPTPEESARLYDEVRELAWRRARELAGLAEGSPPRSPFDEQTLGADGQRAAVLAQLAALREIRAHAERLIEQTVIVAGATGAGVQAIGRALKITRSAVHRTHPDAVVGASGPRPAASTRYGRADWAEPAAERVAADRDWMIRARVRLLTDVAATGASPLRVARAGDELVMVMRGRAGTWVATDIWHTDEPVPQALIVDATCVTVLQVLEETSPWVDRRLDLPSSPDAATLT